MQDNVNVSTHLVLNSLRAKHGIA
jgi:hypothetical protein